MQEREKRKEICSRNLSPPRKLIMHILIRGFHLPLSVALQRIVCQAILSKFCRLGSCDHMAADHDQAYLVALCIYAPSSSSPTRMAPSDARPLDQKPSIEAELGTSQTHMMFVEGPVNAYFDMASWVKRSQNPKTGLARISRTAYATISESTLMLRDPSATPQML